LVICEGPFDAMKLWQAGFDALGLGTCHASRHHVRLIKKAAKAQWYANNEGLVYGKVLSFCPLNWRLEDDVATEVAQAAADSCFFPLYEVERGRTTITYDPEAVGRRIKLGEYLGMMGKTRHLLSEENKPILEAGEIEVERRWLRLKAMHEHPLL
jgi:pyruvate ferredoxin oxidoreductase alpha subunit